MSTFAITPSAGRRDLCSLCHAEVGNHPAFSALAHTTAGKTHYVHLGCFKTLQKLIDRENLTPTRCVCNTSIPEAARDAYRNESIAMALHPLQAMLAQQLLTDVSSGNLDAIRKILQGGYIIDSCRMQALTHAACHGHPEIIPLLLHNARMSERYRDDLGALLCNVIYDNDPAKSDQVLAALLAILATGLTDQTDRDDLIECMANERFSEIIPKLLPRCPISEEGRGKAVLKLLYWGHFEIADFLLKTGPVPTEDLREALELFKK